MKILLIIFLSILSSILYRLGGSAKKGNWLDILRNTKTRDWGCPLVAFLVMLLFGFHSQWWIHLAAFLIMFGALTTYWDKIFGYDNFYMHGGMIAFAYLPYAIVQGCWVGFVIRCVVLALFMGIWCKVFSNDITEEVGRGASIVATLPLLLIG